MKHITLGLISAALACAQATPVRDIPLPRFCDFAGTRSVQVDTAAGETVQGVCFSVTKDEVRIQTPHGIVAITKAQLTRVQVYEVKPRRQIAGVGKWIGRQVKQGAEMIPTPFGLVGLTKISMSLAAGAVAMPFAGLGDLLGYSKSIEVRIQ
jgi:hypothetical protein